MPTSRAAQTRYMDRAYKAIGNAVTGDIKVVQTSDSIRVILPSNVMFDYKLATVREQAIPSIKRLAKAFRKYDRTFIMVTGHADAIGGDGAYNRALSQRRADSVRDVIVSYGVAPDRVITWARSSKEPIATNETEEGRALNRRVEFIVLYKSE